MTSLRKLRNFLVNSPTRRATFFRAKKKLALSWAFFSIFGRLINRAGSPFLIVARPDFDYDNQNFAEFQTLHRIWKKGVEINNGSDLVRLFLLCLNLRQVCSEAIPGDFVELGVYKGNSAAILCHYATNLGRRVFLFDTFSGFDASDFQGIDVNVNHAGFVDTSLDDVKKIVGIEQHVIYVAGLFPDSIKEAPELPETIAVLHIDCDLYAPMKAGLEYFYPKMSKGGLILLHDYGSMHWPGATKAIDDFFSDKPEKIIVIPDKSGTAAVRRS